jgi:hypothetical protein
MLLGLQVGRLLEVLVVARQGEAFSPWHQGQPPVQLTEGSCPGAMHPQLIGVLLDVGREVGDDAQIPVVHLLIWDNLVRVHCSTHPQQ